MCSYNTATVNGLHVHMNNSAF